MKLPTRKQWQAYYLTEILQHNQRQAASAMGISQPMVSRHIAAVMAKIPILVPASAMNTPPPNLLSYDPGMDYGIVRQF